MRLHFSLSPPKGSVPFAFQHFLTGTFHRWLGQNELHDGLSLYSLSWLQGGFKRGDDLAFPQGARWFISAPDTSAGDDLLHRVADAALKSPEVCCGMEVVQIQKQETPDFGPRRLFRADSPVFLRADRSDDGVDRHIIFSDPDADAMLTRILRLKMVTAGLTEHAETATMRFDPDFRWPKTKVVHIKEFGKRANVCPVIVEGGSEAVKFAFNVGAGHLTGSCFGSLI